MVIHIKKFTRYHSNHKLNKGGRRFVKNVPLDLKREITVFADFSFKMKIKNITYLIIKIDILWHSKNLNPLVLISV